MRLPPTVNAKVAAAAMKTALEENPPHGSQIVFRVDEPSDGWNAPNLASWLAEAIDAASKTYFGNPSAAFGEGGSIPFMGMLGRKFPHAQFVVTGVLGPESNAHGPNEFLHIPTFHNITAAIATILSRVPPSET
jgi:acetylornithine deacetylase/succinyl-diaminopimelate desuccinylase-like protein